MPQISIYYNSFSIIFLVCICPLTLLYIWIYPFCLVYVNYLIAFGVYRSYGSCVFLEVSVSSSHSLTSSLRAFSLSSTVVINCSAIIWFWNSVCIALWVVFLSISTLQLSLEPRIDLGKIWCFEYWSSSLGI